MRKIPDEAFPDKTKIAQSWIDHKTALDAFRSAKGLESLPGFILAIVKEKLWKRVWLQPNGRVVEFDSFEEYLTTKTPNGLGATVQGIKDICRNNVEALDAIDAALQGEHGGNHNPEGANQHSEGAEEEVNVDNIHIDQPKRPSGTSRDAALRRLRSQRPDLHKKVLDGDCSAHAAMLEAGFRKQKTPKEHVLHWWAKCSNEEREELLEQFAGQSV